MARRKMALQDLTTKDLPHTRRELFFDILKQRFKLLLVLGILLVIAMIPMLAVFLLKNISLQNLASGYDFSNISDEQLMEFNSIYAQQINFWNLFQLPCFVILSIYLAGFIRIIKRLNFGESISIKDDLKTGIKQNWFQYMIISIIIFVLFYLSSLIANLNIESPILTYLPAGLSIVIFTPLTLTMLCIINTYQVKFSQLFKNGFALSLKNILWNLVFIVALFAPILLFLISYYLIAFAIFILIAAFYYPIFFTANYVFNYSSFDKYINEKNYPEYFRKGLY